MSADKDNLMDPTNPNSPFNKFNWNAPYSILNPLSPHYLKSEGGSDPFWGGVVIFFFIAALVVGRIYFLFNPM